LDYVASGIERGANISTVGV